MRIARMRTYGSESAQLKRPLLKLTDDAGIAPLDRTAAPRCAMAELRWIAFVCTKPGSTGLVARGTAVVPASPACGAESRSSCVREGAQASVFVSPAGQ